MAYGVDEYPDPPDITYERIEKEYDENLTERFDGDEHDQRYKSEDTRGATERAQADEAPKDEKALRILAHESPKEQA